jgi:hypothetical protein
VRFQRDYFFPSSLCPESSKLRTLIVISIPSGDFNSVSSADGRTEPSGSRGFGRVLKLGSGF